ncbi:MAG: thioredoxin domain-containing protein [Actinomycetota bacterium]
MSEPSLRPENHLAGETSPYLVAHAHNPVDWYPWGEEAIAKARAEDRPVFLSIGYAACHWCHVMERESFEDATTASLLNERFVSIKVDREERPDLDGIYMDAVQAMTGQGGWPMSVFLTPEGEPFYAGTYFPPEARHGLPGFRDVLLGVSEAWRDRRSELVGQAGRVAEAITRATQVLPSRAALDATIPEEATESLRRSFDHRWGGFGPAPKFPQPMTLEFLLRRAVRGSGPALEMVTTTLDRMAQGGIRDHVGGGFARYSTDGRWHVPHFEKMLYDNALLLQLYTRVWQVTGFERYREVVVDTAEYLLREMQHPDGGFFSSQDADSEGVEGRFFTWTWPELVGLVGEPVARAFGARPEGNWDGTNVLWRPDAIESVASAVGVAPDELATRLADARATLFEARESRPRPATDDKVLAAWNGMAIGAFAEAGRALGEPRFVEAAVRAATFVLGHLRDDGGRLLRSWRGGVAGGPGFADDHASMGAACLTLYETTFGLSWFEHARTLLDELRSLFHDDDAGGFFQTGSDAEALLVRPKELYDNATPSGNSVTAELLVRMAAMTGDHELSAEAEGALRLVADGARRAPGAFGHALGVLDRVIGPHREVAIVGDPDGDDTRALAAEVMVRRYRPNLVLAVAAPQNDSARRAVPLLRGRSAIGGSATAYVCEGFTCRVPVTAPEALGAQLDEAVGA